VEEQCNETWSLNDGSGVQMSFEYVIIIVPSLIIKAFVSIDFVYEGQIIWLLRLVKLRLQGMYLLLLNCELEDYCCDADFYYS
jgi:hypothetical protein